MPQMSPLMWISLYLYVLFLLLMFMMFIYYFYLINMNLVMNDLSIKFNFYKFKW